ncbi:hypothetical protein L6R53_18125 [Myxococcota bacterium]|nr:hypothetical protein [Myxococcota bacterium]
MTGGPLLYVHPYGHVLDELVPMGAVALVNRCEVDKRGRYAWELTEAEVATAGCLAMDLHWYFSVEAVGWIAAHCKRLRPDLPIVLGGITASFYARHLLSVFPVDYVVQGDGEQCFPVLVQALCEGRTPPPLPNVWTRQGPPPALSPVPAPVYDDNDYLDLSWFPTLRQDTAAAHRRYAAAPFWGLMDRFHPYLPLNRGCRFPCGVCFGSWQRDVFGHGQVDRSVAALARGLDAVEAHPDYRFVNLTAGTEDIRRLRDYRPALGRRRALGAYLMHFCALPDEADLQLLLDAFDRVCVDFTNPDELPLPLRAAGMDARAAQDRIAALCVAAEGEERLRVGVSFLSTEPHPFKDRLRALGLSRLELKENSEWALPRPDLRTLGEVRGSEEREAAKTAQAEGFRAVSRGHARYLLARAASPGLHPLLDQSVLQRVDGAPVVALSVPPRVAPWLSVYQARFRRWHVTTLETVELRLCPTGDPVEAAGLRPVRTWGPDLGEVRVEPALDGLRLSWRGPVPAGATGLVLRALCQAEEGILLDPAEVEGLPHLVLPLSADPAGQPGAARQVTVTGTLSSARCVLRWQAHEHRWHGSELRPPTPFDPAPAAELQGPQDKVDRPWPDDAPAQDLARAALSALVAPWAGRLVVAEARWACLDLEDGQGPPLRVFLLPPGRDPCAHAGPRGRLVVQGARQGGIPGPVWAAVVAALGAR